MRVLGLDISLNTGVVDLSFHTRTEDKVNLSPYKVNLSTVLTSPIIKAPMGRFPRYAKIAEKLLEIIAKNKYDGIFIEGYSYGSSHNLATMGEIGAILRYFVWQEDEERLIVEIPPNSLKTFVTGKGNAKKEMILKEVFKHWKFDASTNDEADAFGLAMFGVAWLGGEINLPKKNLEAITKVKTEWVKNYS